MHASAVAAAAAAVAAVCAVHVCTRQRLRRLAAVAAACLLAAAAAAVSVYCCTWCLLRYGYIDFESHEAAVEALRKYHQAQQQQKQQEDKQQQQQEAGEQEIRTAAGVPPMLLGGHRFELAPSIPMKNHRWVIAPVNKARVSFCLSQSLLLSLLSSPARLSLRGGLGFRV